MVFPDDVAFDFLLYAWDEDPDTMSDALESKDLTELLVEVSFSGGSDYYTIRLVYENSQTRQTVSMSAEHLGNSTFGTITVF